MPRVTVHPSRPFDPAVVAHLLGEPPLPVVPHAEIPAPFISINGRIHRPTSDYLRHYAGARAESDTAHRYASDLRAWLDFLCNERGYHCHEDHRDPVFAATEDDFAAYWRRRQHGDDEHRLSSAGWSNARKAIKRFYEYAQRAYYHQPPFEIRAFQTQHGFRGTRIEGYAPRRRHAGSAGTPLSPTYAEHLLMGALRIDLEGRQRAYLGADRDHALISLVLATGIRRHNLNNITTYEIPPLADLPFTTTQVADLITKNDAGGDALTFTHRLPAVHNYIHGARNEEAHRRPFRPHAPLHIVSADRRGVQYTDPLSEQPDLVRSRLWAEADAKLRTRLVNADGTSPILFLNALTGAPLSYSAMQHVVTGAAHFVREHIDPDFPPGFRLHDLRHTYAVHLTIAIYRDVLADALGRRSQPNEAWIVDHIAAAVDLVQYSLGHASEDSTKLYTQTAHRFLPIPIEQFLGGA